MKCAKIFFIVLGLFFGTVFVCPLLPAQSLAFPGAEGFGKYTTGGRGGEVLFVTNLNDDGEGSLRKAVRHHGPRIVIFKVSGNIALESPLDINNPDITIAGQSAPGQGICIQNYSVNVKTDNVIIRYLRFRMGDLKQYEGDAIGGTAHHKNIIIDHCSMSWSTDECASFYHNTNFTMQWCLLSESLKHSVHEKGNHGYGGIWGGDGATFHHNLLASHSSRNPRFSGSPSTKNDKDELVDFSNNVIFNWEFNSTYGGEAGRYNMVNNYYKPGPATQKSKKSLILNPWEPAGKFYLSGNVMEGDELVTTDNWKGVHPKSGVLDSFKVMQPFEVVSIDLQNPEEAFENVLKKSGANLYRDEVDRRIIEEVRTRAVRFGENGIIDSQKDVGGWPVLKATEPLPDADKDGMPDAWEEAMGLNPHQPNASDYSLSKDYTDIEVYLNSLVEEVR